MAKDKIFSSLLITTEENILVQDTGDKRMKLPSIAKKTNQSIQQSASHFAAGLHKQLKVGGILFVVEDLAEVKGFFSTTQVNATSFVFNVRNHDEFKVKKPFVWLSFDHLDQLDIADELKQIIVSNQVIKSSVPLINLH
ncbi:hypothetical protein ERX37_03140 [Macrococcus hajekii]|uniref:Uncharacterized protein n=1 Tax=Macrococcus hajekii TaxID=198482 RepID=A0A4R6BMM7_9STAP|nr:hypothetical protein [Macrococcus hajekii]TDM03094.1 hypothetical protein ERX37_03140 [Macrococcus hajekii]GGB06463.1 hypothetical protein GCM10007190_13210 [Macrococcus hajekii]